MTAGRIIADREANGAFTYKQAITRVRGVGSATFAGLEDLISVGDGTLGGDIVDEGQDNGGAAECQADAGRVNLNTANAALLDTLPNIGQVTAANVIADRDANGPYANVSDITRVRGIGAATLRRIADFATVGAACDVNNDDDDDGDDQNDADACEIGVGLVNVNTADARALDTLPGVGPSTAARIIADREDNGPFAILADLTRVRGIGSATVARLEAFATVGGIADHADDYVIPDAPEEEDRTVHLNDGHLAELLTLPGMTDAAAIAISTYTRQDGIFVSLAEIEALTGIDTSAWHAAAYTLAAHRVYFTPFKEGGAGFAAQNRAKTLPLDDGLGSCDETVASIVNAFVDMVNRVPDGGLIQLAIYGYSVRTPEHAAIVDAVENRGVRLQVSIDTSVKNSRGVPYSNDEVAAFRRLDGDVEVRTLRYSSKTLHEKFAIFDGTHVMNGSANISTKANSRYAETRMFFWNSEVVTQAFEVEFDRLWNELGVEPPRP